jgi:hypothetical protein
MRGAGGSGRKVCVGERERERKRERENSLKKRNRVFFLNHSAAHSRNVSYFNP